MDWLYAAALGGAVVAGAAGVGSTPRRGEATLAIAAFAFSLVLPAIYAFVFLLFAPLGGID